MSPQSSTGDAVDQPDQRSRVSQLAHGVMNHPRVRPAADFVRRLAQAWREDNVTGLSAEVAFFALLSIFPGLLAVAATIGFLDRILGAEVAGQAEDEVVGLLQMFLTEHASGTTEAVQSLFDHGNGGLLTLGAIGFFWAGSRGMAAVLRALGRIYDTPDTRSVLRQRFIALGLTAASALVAALTLAMLVLGPLLGLGRGTAVALGLEAAYGEVWEWLALPVMFAVLLGWAAVAMHSSAHHHWRWRQHLIGATVTGVGCLLGSYAFRVYLAVFGGNQVYGVLGGAVVVLLWLYVLSMALLTGAEVDAVLTARRAPAGSPTASPVSASGGASDGAAARRVRLEAPARQ